MNEYIINDNYKGYMNYKNSCIIMTILNGLLLLILFIFLALSYNLSRQIKIELQSPIFITSRTVNIVASIKNKNKIIYKTYFYYGLNNNRYYNSTKTIFSFSDTISSLITNLEPNTLYYYQAVIEPSSNNQKNGLSQWGNFTTLRAPILTILPPSNMTNISTVLHGAIKNYGSQYLYYRFAYKLVISQKYIYTNFNKVPSHGISIFEYKLEGLINETDYVTYIEAYEEFSNYNYKSDECYFILGKNICG